ncbi:MAG: hypothetical protein AAFW69_10555 [Pseudomonadota bacterium]
MNQQATGSGDPLLTPKIVYGLFAVGYFVVLTTIVGVIIAYFSRGKDGVADSHLNHLIETFWISLIVGIIGVALTFFGIGFLVLLALAVWGLIRVITGVMLILDGKPVTGTQFVGARAV